MLIVHERRITYRKLQYVLISFSFVKTFCSASLNFLPSLSLTHIDKLFFEAIREIFEEGRLLLEVVQHHKILHTHMVSLAPHLPQRPLAQFSRHVWEISDLLCFWQAYVCM